MDLLTSTLDWSELKKRFKPRYDLENMHIIGFPSSFPCLVSTRLQKDLNGYTIYCSFFYIEDANKLLNLDNH